MRNAVVAALLALICGSAASAANAPTQSARDLLRASMAAMGGEARLRSIVALDYIAVGERKMVEQSVRPDGPYYVDHFRIHEIRDIAGGRTRIEREDEGYAANMWWLQQTAPAKSTIVVNGPWAGIVDDATFDPASPSYGAFDAEQAALAPERLLLTAYDASNATIGPGPDGTESVTFPWHGTHVTIYLDRSTHLPRGLAYDQAFPYSIFLNAWGDVYTQIFFEEWTLEPFGIRYPREVTYQRGGQPDQAYQIVAMTINPSLASVGLDLPTALKSKPPEPVDAIRLGEGGDGPVHDLAPGVTLYPGRWNVGFIRQSDGVVVIEAPISSNYAKDEFAYVRDVLHAKVKAVITTSDSWPHVAGLRQAAAEYIPIYLLDKNFVIVTRILGAQHSLRPDDLQDRPIARAGLPPPPDLHMVGGPTDLGTGTNRITMLPYRTATGERQMMVWLPGPGLLYTSDLFAPNGDDGWFTPEYLKEATEAVARYKIAPTSVWGMHYGLTPWSSILEEVTHFAPQ